MKVVLAIIKRISILITMPLSLLWGMVVGIRSMLFACGVYKQTSFKLPVICVGNLAVGGTGKTPHVEYLLKMLHTEGYRVAMLSRGYGRKTKGYVLANAQTTAREIGDEPYQVLQNCPFAIVAVCEKRVIGIQQLLKDHSEVDVIVLDDAYQHRYVKAGLNVLLTDSHRLYTQDHLLPWGRLREPAAAAQRAQVVVVTKCEGCKRPPLKVAPHQHLYYSEIVYAPLQPLMVPSASAEALNVGVTTSNALLKKHAKVLLIAAIANPQPLVNHLRAQGAEVVLAEFRDHHNFQAVDAQRISRLWSEHACTLAVTTQKDQERLIAIHELLPQTLTENMVVQPITVKLSAANNEDINTFNQTILHYVRTNQRNCSVD